MKEDRALTSGAKRIEEIARIEGHLRMHLVLAGFREGDMECLRD